MDTRESFFLELFSADFVFLREFANASFRRQRPFERTCIAKVPLERHVVKGCVACLFKVGYARELDHWGRATHSDKGLAVEARLRHVLLDHLLVYEAH